MTYIASDTPWHSTDGDPIPVRPSHTDGPDSATQPHGPVPIQFSDQATGPLRTSYVRIDPPQSSAGLAAVTGISVVLVLGTVFYLGIDNLRTSLLGQSKQVTITALGAFDPATINIQRGETLTIVNNNADPQILKAQDTELFPSQMLFKDQQKPYTFTVPTSAALQSYVYTSETLPSSEKLTITVTDASGTSSSAAASLQSSDFIPIPSDVQTVRSSQASTVSNTTPPIDAVDAVNPSTIPPAASSHSTISAGYTTAASSQTGPSDQVIRASNGSAVTVLQIQGTHGAATSLSSSAPSSSSASVYIPVNPYTVGRQGLNRTSTIVSQATKSPLHSGAPLNQYTQSTTTTASGPEIVWTMIATMLLFALVYKQSTRREARG